MTPATPRDPHDRSARLGPSPVATEPAAVRAETCSTEAFLERLRQAPPPEDVAAVPVIAGVTILERVSRGGMGIVFRGRLDVTGNEVAVKVLSGAGGSPSTQARARREAEVLTRLDHPNIIRLLSWGSCPLSGGVHDAVPYIVMEWIAGGSLDRFVGTERLGHRDAVELVREVALAVADEPAVFFHTQRLVTALREQAMHHAAVGRPDDALAAYDRIREVLAPWKDSDSQREAVSTWIASASSEAAGLIRRRRGIGIGHPPEDEP